MVIFFKVYFLTLPDLGGGGGLVEQTPQRFLLDNFW